MRYLDSDEGPPILPVMRYLRLGRGRLWGGRRADTPLACQAHNAHSARWSGRVSYVVISVG